MRVGFVGLGVMGQPMALNVRKAGHDLRVYNRTVERTEALRAAGAEVASSPREAAQGAAVVITIVTDDEAVRAVAEGSDGVLAGLEPGGVVIDMSTISPTTTRALAEASRARQLVWMDAPVTGGDIGARDGTLTIMVGGPEAVFRRLRPLLESMGERIVYVGPSGMGQSLKLVGNLVSGLTLLSAAEGIRLADAAGIPPQVVEQVLPFSSARSFELDKALERRREHRFEPGFSVANRTKDMRLAVEMAEALGFPPALAAVAYQIWAGHAERFGVEDESSIQKRWNGAVNRRGDAT